MQTFKTKDGLEIAYYVDDFTNPWTKPDTLLMLHAAMGNSRRWFRWVPQLARHFRVVRMDMRGHGASPMTPPEAEFSLSQLVGDAVSLLDVLGCGSAHVVGNSAGGYVSQQLAIHHPARVRTLALYGSTPGLKHSHAPTWIPKIREVGMKKFLADTIYERFDATADPKLVEWFINDAATNDPANIARFVTHMTTHDFMEDLHRIQCPTLMVAAGKEPIGQASTYEEMRKRIRDSELIFIDTTGHNICDGYADRCAAELLGFLSRRGYCDARRIQR